MKLAHLTRNTLVIGMAVLGLAGTAQAADVQPGRHAQAANAEQRQAAWAERAAERAAKRQAKLREALKITPAQEAPFKAYLASHQRTGERKGARRLDRAERAAMAATPAPQRMEQRLAMAKQRIAAMETRLAALNSLYAVLTPEQKKVFDELGQRGGRMHGHGRRHGKHHGMVS